VSSGGAQLVFCNSLHDAEFQAQSVEAYVELTREPTFPHAACTERLTSFDYDRFLHWKHSIQQSPKYQNPFTAVLSALIARWDVLSAQFCDVIANLRSDHNEDACMNDQPNTVPMSLISSFAPDVAAPQVLLGELRSCIKKRNRCVAPESASISNSRGNSSRNVRFHSGVCVLIGIEDEIMMSSSFMQHDELSSWLDKPWSKRPNKAEKSSKHGQDISPDTLRTTDAYHDVPSTWSRDRNQPPEEAREDPEDANHFLHEAPESVQYLFDALQTEGVVEGPRIHDSVFLRSWFVHHTHMQQCFHSRIIEINGHWRLWFQDIIDSWRDKILPLEQVIFDIVRPNPPRTEAHQEILLDLIISQGIDLPRRAGLVTILQKDDREARAAYAVAASLPEQTSGYQIVQSAEYLFGCQIYQCSIRHGWYRIPFTMAPVHNTQDGDSFVVAVASRAESSSVPAGESGNNEPHGGSESYDDPFDPEGDSDMPSPSLATSADQQSGVHIHRLGHRQRHVKIRWDTIDHVLSDVARIFNIPVDDLRTFHHLQVAPPDQHINEEGIILQHVSDIPDGSTEKLILIDVEMHQAHRHDTVPRAPPVLRQVHRTVPNLVRRHILLLTHTAGYCDWHPLDCIVLLNNALWPQQDLNPKRIEHGMYIRVIILSPPESNWDIGRALQVFHDAFELFDPHYAGQIAFDIMQGPSSNLEPSVPHQSIAACPPTLDVDHHEINDQDAIDAISFMQHDLPRISNIEDIIDLNATSHGSSDIIPEDWIIDLQRIVQHHENICPHDPDAEFIVSVYTWLVDHQTQRLCNTPKIAILGGDPTEWYEDILHPWRFQIQDDQPIFLDIVQPHVQRSDIEEHIVHIIITQRQSADRSVLLSMNFKGEMPPDVIIRFAVVLPKSCTAQHVSEAVPLYALHSLNRIVWEHPVLLFDDQVFQTRQGLGIQVTVWPETDPVNERSDDSVSLLQGNAATSANELSLINPENNLSRGQCLKGTEVQDDIDVPMLSRRQTTRLPRRPRPFHDGSEQWFWDLGSIFSAQATQEVIDGDSYIYVQTWFIDHERHDTCRVPRTLRLDQNWVMWIEECRYLWRDLLDPSIPFSIHVVKPRPPQSRWQAFNCHLLIEQRRPIGRAAGILTALNLETQTDGSTQGAFAMSRHIRKQDVIDILELNTICDDHQCTVLHFRDLVNIVLATEVTSGFSIRVHISRGDRQLPLVPHDETWEPDQVHLMQQAPIGQAIDMPPNDTECSNFDLVFQLNAAAQPFQPGRVAHAEQSEFLQDLTSLWATVAYLWDPDSPAATFMTWFVDHRLLYPNCIAGRVVTLTNDFDAWETKLKAAWNEVIDPQSTQELHLVTMQPPNLEPGIIGHIIIIQSPADTWVSSLVTVFDSFISHREQNMRRLVVTTDEHIRVEQVISHCGYELIDGRLDPVLHSRFWIDGHELVEGTRWPGRSGHAITVQINRQVVRLQDLEMDHNALLQTAKPAVSVLILEDLLEVQQLETETIPFGLLHMDFLPQLPDTVFLRDGCSEHEVEQELAFMGHSRHVYQLEGTGKFVTVPTNWNPEKKMHHYIFYPTHDTDEGEILMHSSHDPLSEIDHMRYLHAQGFLRAVIVHINTKRWNLIIVQYHNNIPELESKQVTPAVRTPWPNHSNSARLCP